MRSLYQGLRHLFIPCFVLWLLNASWGQTSKAIAPELKLANKLGVETTIPMGKVKLADAALDHAIRPGDIPLEVDKAMVLYIPCHLFESAELVEGNHLVKVAGGREFVGKLMGTITDDGRSYDLATCTRLAWARKPLVPDRPGRAGEAPPQRWRLETKKMKGHTCDVENPEFIFGYWLRNSWLTDTTTSFELTVGNEKILANIADFETLSFKDHGEDKDILVTVRAKGGAESTGTAVMQTSKYGRTDRGVGSWAIRMDWADSGGIGIIFRRPDCTLKLLEATKSSFSATSASVPASRAQR